MNQINAIDDIYVVAEILKLTFSELLQRSQGFAWCFQFDKCHPGIGKKDDAIWHTVQAWTNKLRTQTAFILNCFNESCFDLFLA